ncbi:hypothetical protein RHMOL_Rhmol11G0083100 [Rhododendron molle]|uniref:Uncharacterized protein n=1 Tax=Rhododendron molle TaxID=49168 RepID=A0ACC0LQY0_RHOML|nr:hypothetical protein RHMOL_Rhmol11G0083100 [Rhododendron molle]
MVAAKGMYTGEFIFCGKKANLMVGNVLPLKSIPEGGVFVMLSTMSGIVGCWLGHLGIMLLLSVTIPIMITAVAGGGRTEKLLLKVGNAYHKYRVKRNCWLKVLGVAMNPLEHPHGGGNHHHIGHASTVRRDAPLGQKMKKCSLSHALTIFENDNTMNLCLMALGDDDELHLSLKKASQLFVLCDVDIGLYEFCSGDRICRWSVNCEAIFRPNLLTDRHLDVIKTFCRCRRLLVAMFVVLVMTLRRKPEVLISLRPIVKENLKYQGQDKLPVTIWVIAQLFRGVADLSWEASTIIIWCLTQNPDYYKY